ncbi:hypothetical protein CCP3SC5AM1_60038 [Gammaproteobacteria bacterium]
MDKASEGIDSIRPPLAKINMKIAAKMLKQTPMTMLTKTPNKISPKRPRG